MLLIKLQDFIHTYCCLGAIVKTLPDILIDLHAESSFNDHFAVMTVHRNYLKCQAQTFTSWKRFTCFFVFFVSIKLVTDWNLLKLQNADPHRHLERIHPPQN